MAVALGEYLDRPERMRAHGAAGRARAEESFSLDAMVASYLAVYDQLLLPPGHPSKPGENP
jgi:glycosyltransferase involved in cell wall biosynthesis